MSHFTSLLNNTFTILRLAPASNGQGGWQEAWTELGSALGRLRPTGGSEVEVGGAMERLLTYVLYVPGDTDIARGDKAVCGELTLSVLGVRNPSQAGHHLEVDCQARQRAELTEA